MSDSNELSRQRQSRYSWVQRGLRVSWSLVLVSLVWGLGFSGGARSMGPEVAVSVPAWDGSFTVVTGFHHQVRASRPGLAELRAAYLARLEKNLNQSIIGFWYPKCLDRKNGGYAINFGPTGEPKGDGAKMIVTQARMVWLFARLARARQAADLGKEPGISRRGDTQNSAGEPGRPGSKDYLDAADLGYRFLKDEIWD